MMLSNARPTSPNGFLPPYRFWMMDPSLLWPLMLTPPNPDGSSSAEMAKSLRFSFYVIRIMALQSPRYQIIQLNRNLQTRPVFAIWDSSRSSFWPNGRRSFQRVDFSFHFYFPPVRLSVIYFLQRDWCQLELARWSKSSSILSSFYLWRSIKPSFWPLNSFPF